MPNMIIWVIGFVVYRILMNVDMPVGNTLPDMVITIILCLIAGKLIPEKIRKNKKLRKMAAVPVVNNLLAQRPFMIKFIDKIYQLS